MSATPSRRVVVFGASGPVGQAVLPRLTAAGFAVAAQSRARQQAQAGVTWSRARLPDAVPEIGPSDVVLSLGPLDLFAAWLAGASLARGTRLLALSSMSVLSKASSPHPGERALAARLRHAEHELAQHAARCGASWTILRPTMIYGSGRDRNVARVMARAMRSGVLPVPMTRGLRQPVHVEDLAHAVVAAIDTPASASLVIEIGGGERLGAGDMARRMRALLPRRVLMLPLPPWVARLARIAAKHSLAAAALARLEQDLVADNHRLECILHVFPRRFEPPPARE